MTAEELAHAVGTEAAHEMASALARIKHCLNQLNDEIGGKLSWEGGPQGELGFL